MKKKIEKEMTPLRKASLDYFHNCWLIKGVEANLKMLFSKLCVDPNYHEGLQYGFYELINKIKKENEIQAIEKGVTLKI